MNLVEFQKAEADLIVDQLPVGGVLRAGRANDVQAGRVDAALVLVSRGTEGVHRGHRGGAPMRDGLLGHRDEPLVPAVVSAEPRGVEGGLGRGRKGDRRGDQNRA